MILQAIIKTADGEAVGLLVLSEKTFATGSKGYHSQGELDLAGKRFQAQCQLVEIGSKPGDGQAVTDGNTTATR